MTKGSRVLEKKVNGAQVSNTVFSHLKSKCVRPRLKPCLVVFHLVSKRVMVRNHSCFHFQIKLTTGFAARRRLSFYQPKKKTLLVLQCNEPNRGHPTFFYQSQDEFRTKESEFVYIGPIANEGLTAKSLFPSTKRQLNIY